MSAEDVLTIGKATCPPGCKHPDEPHEFFVSLVRDNRMSLLLGPYATHQEALANVDRSRELAYKVDPWSWFDPIGTVAMKPGHRGVLEPVATNAQITGAES